MIESKEILEGVKLTALKQVKVADGDIYHALKISEPSFISFGEAYFSSIHFGKRKGWKKHTRMTLNVVVPIGEILFVLYDDREESASSGKFFATVLSPSNYHRLTVPPGVWMAFEGKGQGQNTLLNIASIEHDPFESINLPIENDHIKYHWT
jgi:dTDP-4-dehydrorhamnose 3,5-epimerase